MTSTAADLDALVENRTVATEYLRLIENHPEQRALRWMDGDAWQEMTFGEMADQVARVAAGLQDLGVEQGDRVVLMMRNIPQFHVADLAVIFCGATPISIYNSSSAEQVQYLAGHAKAKVAILEDSGFFERFEAVADSLPLLDQIVTLDDTAGTVAWSELLKSEPLDLEANAARVSPEDLATVIYTSGTTGNPKGVMLSHRNLLWAAESILECFGWERAEAVGTRLVSYLPMAHIAERMTSHYGMIFFGYEISTCPEPSEIASYAREVRPNLMFGVPRVWEKIHAGVSAALAADPEKQQKFNEAVEAAIPIVDRMTWGTATDEDKATYEFLDAVAFSTVRDLIGLDQLQLAVSGAAPMHPDLLRWFRAIGIPATEIYGMSESSGPISMSPYKVKPGSVGLPFPGTEIRLGEDGEVQHRGGNVFEGYLDDPEKTAETMGSDGWLLTGDIGEIDEDGYLTIVDRKKELIITAGGKNVSPANLEAALKQCPLIGQAAVIGDQRPFVSALVTLDPELTPLWAAQNGLEGLSLQELATNEVVLAEIERARAEAMKAFNNAEAVKRVKVLGEEWLPDSDVLTPTSKLKRRGVNERYAEDIEAIYH